MRFDRILRGILLFIAVLIFIFATIYVAKAQVPMPVGVASYITVDGNPIDDGYSVVIKNENTGEVVYKETSNGYCVAGISGSDGDLINVSIEYNGKLYYNTTIVDISKSTQWVNISIKTNINNSSNRSPVIVFPDEITGFVGNEITFDASKCYDPDGYITKYEWTFYDYPPFSKVGKIVNVVFDHECNILGLLRVYDNDYSYSTKEFSIIITENTSENSSNDFSNSTNSSIENNSTNITFPPMPPQANFTLSKSYFDNGTLYLNFISTSYDPDGHIVNWTWTIDGTLYYGENITAEVPVAGVNKSFVKINVTLLVTDNDGLYDEINSVVTLNTSWLNEKKYHLTIYSPKPVNIKLLKNGEQILSDHGTKFEYYLPSGNYSIVYAYNGNEFRKSINLNKNTEILLDIPKNYENKTPAFGLLAIILSFGVIIYVKKKS